MIVGIERTLTTPMMPDTTTAATTGKDVSEAETTVRVTRIASVVEGRERDDDRPRGGRDDRNYRDRHDSSRRNRNARGDDKRNNDKPPPPGRHQRAATY